MSSSASCESTSRVLDRLQRICPRVIVDEASSSLPSLRDSSFVVRGRACTASSTVQPFTTSSTSTSTSTRPRLLIYYGSQTGTALGFAHELRKSAEKHRALHGQRTFDATVIDLAHFHPNLLLASGLHIFITACFGHGEPTDNARAFYRWLMHADRERVDYARGRFQGIHYCCFGLGQSQHYPERYQRVTKEIDARLSDLGAQRQLVRGEGDSHGDIEQHFEAWMVQLWRKIEQLEQQTPNVFNEIFFTPRVADASLSSSLSSSSSASSATSAEWETLTVTMQRPPPPFVSTLLPLSLDQAATSRQRTKQSSVATARDIASSNVAPPVAPFASSPPPPPACDVPRSTLADVTLTATTATTASSCATSTASPSTSPYDVRWPFEARIIAHRHMSICPPSIRNPSDSTDFRDSVFVKFDLTGSRLQYSSGDYVGVYPQNDTALVRAFAARLQLDLQQRIDVRRHRVIMSQGNQRLFHDVRRDDQPITHVTLEFLLVNVCDIVSHCRRSLLRGLAQYATSAVEREKLLFLASSSTLGAQDYQNWIVQEQRNVLDVLDAFPSIPPRSIPVDELIDVLPPIQPRYYSIASSPVASPSSLSLCASQVRFRTGGSHRLHRGICTSYLARLSLGDTCPIFIKRSLFRLPLDPSVPILMVGAGAGLAPFRGFLQERIYQRVRLCQRVGLNILFAGCEHREVDFWFAEEWLSAQQDGDLVLRTAFSHDQQWRIFVQHQMVQPQNARLIWEQLLRRGGHVYVCGSATRLAPAVYAALLDIVTTYGHTDGTIGGAEDAERFLQQMKDQHRYQQDVFG